MPAMFRPRFVLLVAVLGSLHAQGAKAFVPEKVPSPFGVADRFHLQEGAAMGAVWVRLDELVYLFEPAPGSWNWVWDSPIADAEAYGLNMSPVIAIGKCWLSGYPGEDWNPSYPPYDLSATWSPTHGYSQVYYDFIYTVVDRYRDRFDRISIEGESNSQWGGTADQYVRTLKTAYLAAHNADPDILVLDSGIASEAWGAVISRERLDSGLYTSQQILDWVNAYYSRSVYFPVHFVTIQDLQNWLSSPFVADQIQRVNYMLDHMGGMTDGLNLKFTEYWWLYADVIDYIDRRTAAAGYHHNLKINNESSVWPGATETQYGRELVQQTVEGLRLGVSATYWFPLSNQMTETPRIGLIDSLGVIRQTGQAFRFASQLINSEFAFDHLDLSVANVRQYVFRHPTDPEHSLRVCWYDNGSHLPGSALVRFYLPTNTLKLIRSDQIGRRTVVDTRGETYMDITVNDSPIYLEFFQNLGAVASVGTSTPPVVTAALEQNFPNPFHPTTTIRFSVPGASGDTHPARLTVYDPRGRAVRHLVSSDMAAGVHEAYWSGETDDGEALPAGIYLYRLECAGTLETRKMILSR